MASQPPRQYQPFKYPPDFALARYHQLTTQPGKPDISKPVCPCCKQHPIISFKSWWNRSIQKDFKRFGGAVVSYFWLLKLYAIAILIVIAIYGAYLHYLSDQYCQKYHLIKETNAMQFCSKLFGIWIITNQDLYTLIQINKQQAVLARYFTLRSITFLVLLITNGLSLYMTRWFKIRYPDKIDMDNFSLFFKNLKNDNIQNLLLTLKKQVGNFQVKQAFIIKKIEPFYTHYQNKLDLYYKSKNQSCPVKYKKILNNLYKSQKKCHEHQQSFYNDGNRAIIVFKSLLTRKNIYQKYKINYLTKIKMFFSTQYQQFHGLYCQNAPRPQQIIWNNAGIIEKQSVKLKLTSIFYFIGILSLLVLFLYFALQVIYIYQIAQPLKSIVQNIILLFIVAVALTFRQWMNKLSEMRFPNTFTNRSIFIVITTVLFHFIFYLFIPSMYLRIHKDKRGQVLNLISNQSITFIVVQVTLAGFDLMYCCWNRRRSMMQNQDKPIGCQKILNKAMQYPRFPIQFKLIILFKIWSLITFFAFHVPLVLFLILGALIFLYIKDKMNAYYHYRMQIIDNTVQWKFLKIYSNVFTVYLYLTFVFTQHDEAQYYIGAGVTIATIIFQTLFFRKLKIDQTDDDSFIQMNIDEIDTKSYQQRYQSFLTDARNDHIDTQIQQFLAKQGYGTMQTQQSVIQNKQSI